MGCWGRQRSGTLVGCAGRGWARSGRLGPLCGQRGGKPGPVGDIELGVHVPEMGGDGLHADEQCLGDLAVGQALDGQLRDPQLAGGQRPGAGDPVAPRPTACGDELVAGPGSQGEPAAACREVQPAAQRLPGVAPVAGATQGRPALGEGPRQLCVASFARPTQASAVQIWRSGLYAVMEIGSSSVTGGWPVASAQVAGVAWQTGPRG